MKTEEISWLCSCTKDLPTEEAFEFVAEQCSPVQTGIIMNHLSLLGDNMLLGYKKDCPDEVFVMIEDGEETKVMLITKGKNKLSLFKKLYLSGGIFHYFKNINRYINKKLNNMKYSEKLSELVESALSELRELIAQKGVESEFMSKVCLKIEDDDFAFNLDGGRYLAEITQNELLDNNGYHYDFNVLDTEDLLDVIDHLIELHS